MKLEWKKKTLEEVCDFSNGLWKGEKAPFVKVGVIRNTNFTKEGTLNDSDIAYLEVEVKKFERRRLQYGDIILEKSGGGPKQPVGRVALFEKQEGIFSFSNFTSALRVKDPEELDFRFLHKLLYWTYLSGVTESMQSHSTGIRNLDGNAYKAIEITFPSLIEQKRIVGILDEAFSHISTARNNAERNLQNARALFESHVQTVFNQRGEGWIEKSLGELATFRNGINFTKASKGESIRILGVKDFQSNFWAPQDAMGSVTPDGVVPDIDTLKEGDLVFVRSNGNPELIGRCVLVGELSERTTHSGFTIRARLHSREVWPRFLCHFLKFGNARREMIEGGNGANIKSLNQGTLAHLSIPLPPMDQQVMIVSRLERLQEETLRLKSLYQSKLDALDELKQSLLHQAFSGELSKNFRSATVIPFPIRIANIEVSDLHAGILAMGYQLHEQRGRQRYFGHVKAEKTAHMIEAYVGIDLEREPIKDAAGPNDFQRLQAIGEHAEKAEYFSFRRINGAGYRITKCRQFDSLIERTRQALGDRCAAVEHLLELMLPMNKRQSEVFCTVYATWNNLLLDGQSPTDEQIVLEARENWHPDKLKIPRENFFNAIKWIRHQGLSPQGRGKRVRDRVE